MRRRNNIPCAGPLGLHSNLTDCSSFTSVKSSGHRYTPLIAELLLSLAKA